MTHNAELTGTPPAPKRARSAAAERMRLHRERRRMGLRCLTIQVFETEIDRLIRNGFLNWEMRNDQIAIRDALHSFLDETLN